MVFDFKKEFKKFYKPSENPEIIEIPKMNFIAVRGKGCSIDLIDKRYHHEIYLSDPRKVDIDKIKTVIRQPIKKMLLSL